MRAARADVTAKYLLLLISGRYHGRVGLPGFGHSTWGLIVGRYPVEVVAKPTPW